METLLIFSGWCRRFLEKLGLSCPDTKKKVPGNILPPSGGPTSAISDAGFCRHLFIINNYKNKTVTQ
jgi:hypothetical protein